MSLIDITCKKDFTRYTTQSQLNIRSISDQDKAKRYRSNRMKFFHKRIV